jgi:hypothetical protein
LPQTSNLFARFADPYSDAHETCSSDEESTTSTSTTQTKAKSDAYATILFGGADYIDGLLGLACSLCQSKTKRPLVVLYTPEVGTALLTHLQQTFIRGGIICDIHSGDDSARVTRKTSYAAQQLPPPSASLASLFNGDGNDDAFRIVLRGTPLIRRRNANAIFERAWTKLGLWQLDDYATVIYLDADTVVQRNIDHLFAAANALSSGGGGASKSTSTPSSPSSSSSSASSSLSTPSAAAPPPPPFVMMAHDVGQYAWRVRFGNVLTSHCSLKAQVSHVYRFLLSCFLSYDRFRTTR